MRYLITFLEGIITFISPCLLPMIPVYVFYFAGDGDGNGRKKYAALVNSLGFVLGFTLFFVAMGAFAGTLGGLLRKYETAVNIVTGLIVVLFGLNFTGVLKIGFLNRTHTRESKVRPNGFFSSALFGLIFSVGWTPCVGAFLGSALMLASQQGSALKGITLLLVYSAGLGIPFVLSAVLIDRLKGAFGFIKKNYKTINLICGLLLVAVGILMMTGLIGKLFGALQ